ncbi:hypothetical protein PUN28_001982 [Cardiocondyla obscurior]|uniref:Uncharacterized protein n=1 Tax=Cardiocondyla obscurior TaxID=286306 RepID=A0AAW2GS02_9HYME
MPSEPRRSFKIENPEKSQGSLVMCGQSGLASAEQPHGKDIVKCWTCLWVNSQHPERRRRPRMGILLRLSNVSCHQICLAELSRCASNR